MAEHAVLALLGAWVLERGLPSGNVLPKNGNKMGVRPARCLGAKACRNLTLSNRAAGGASEPLRAPHGDHRQRHLPLALPAAVQVSDPGLCLWAPHA